MQMISKIEKWKLRCENDRSARVEGFEQLYKDVSRSKFMKIPYLAELLDEWKIDVPRHLVARTSGVSLVF